MPPTLDDSGTWDGAVASAKFDLTLSLTDSGPDIAGWAEYAADLFDAQRVALMVSSDNGLLALRASHGVDAALAERFHEPLNEALVTRLAEFLDGLLEVSSAAPLDGIYHQLAQSDRGLGGLKLGGRGCCGPGI